MSNPNSPEFVLVAVKHIYDELPNLIGQDNWNSIGETVDKHMIAIEKAEKPEQRLLPSTQLFGALAQYEPARLRLASELKIQEIISENIGKAFATFSTDDSALRDQLLAELLAGMRWEIEPETLPNQNEDVRNRGISLESGGTSGGKSLKFRNFTLDLADMMIIAGGFLFTGQDMIDKPKPFVLVAGVLLMVGTLLNAMTKEISQQEATVFWGFLVAASHKVDKQASTARILETTNSEREKRGLNPLTDTQFKYSMKILEQLSSIESVDDSTWRIIERFEIKD